ncbi:hypothetical protein D3C78_1620950 [compost metagenome]
MLTTDGAALSAARLIRSKGLSLAAEPDDPEPLRLDEAGKPVIKLNKRTATTALMMEDNIET